MVLSKFVIINGTLCDASLWQGLERDLRLAGHRDFLYPDIGDGQSIAAYAENIGRGLNPKTANWVIGYSLGGIIAVELALSWPDRIEGLVLVCTNCDGQTSEKEETVRKQLELLDSRGLEAVLDDILLPAYFTESESCMQRSDLDEFKSKVRNMGLKLGAPVLRNQVQTLRSRRNQSSLLPEIEKKALLVCGEEDVLCTLEQNQGMAALLPRSTLKIIKNTGHMLPLLKPGELSAAVRTFLSEVS